MNGILTRPRSPARGFARPAIEGGVPVRAEFLVYARPWILADEIDEVVDTLRSGWLGAGPRVQRFQEAFRQYTGSRHAHAVSSCTAGLHLACLATGIGPGDEVITSPMTFCATANAVLHAGATPVFADVDPRTMNLDPREVELRIGPRTRALLLVHFAGRPCNLDALTAIAREHDLVLIEDCAHAIETLYRDRHAGTFGDVASFSFYATKNVCTGEGGMVLTPRDEIHERIARLAAHGLSRGAWQRYGASRFRHYEVESLGYKYNMTDLQAAIGVHQLRRVELGWSRRLQIWERYDAAFRDLPCFIPAPMEPGTRHALHMYNLLLDLDRLAVDRDRILDALHAENIGVGVHYLGVHRQPYYVERFGFVPEDYPVASWIGERTISLPLTPALSERDVVDVIEAVQRVLSHYELRT